MAEETEEIFRARTAREALLEIRRLAATIDPAKLVSLTAFDEVAVDGLSREGAENYQLSDQLADYLAESHRLLKRVLAEPNVGSETVHDITAALVLPPDLESMIDRRMR